jgi:hypothetical protein
VFANQVHDFNPGIAANKLFWTIRIPDDSVKVHVGQQKASLSVKDLAIQDFFLIPNSLGLVKPPIPPVAVTVSFDINWSGAAKAVKIRDTTNGFAGKFYPDTATMTWSAQEGSSKFVSGKASNSTTVFAEIGRERNGSFFPDDDDDDDDGD